MRSNYSYSLFSSKYSGSYRSTLCRLKSPLYYFQVGCHHCRSPHPLPKDLQKSMVDHRQGTIIALLDDSSETLVIELAKKLPQGREGQAVLWMINKDGTNTDLPENLFIHSDIDRQDLIGKIKFF